MYWYWVWFLLKTKGNRIAHYRTVCIGLRQYPQLLTILQTSPLKPEAIEFLRQSQCGFNGNDPRVCCPIQNENPDLSGGADGAQNAKLQFDLSNNTLLPSDCGRDPTDIAIDPRFSDLSERIVGGVRTDLGEFPWIAHLIYSTPKGESGACGGSVINHRYVLTAAHCLKGTIIPVGWSLSKVRLGEYDTTTNPDCIKDGANSKICADDAITVGIEKQIAHENYSPPSRDQKYDIALLRLDRDIPFTNYIKPICLPSNDAIGTKLIVAGWGKTNNASSSNIKLKVSLPLADKQQCEQKYSSAGVTLGFGQICAGGVPGEDSCAGDSGGPLMDEEKGSDGISRWTAVGVLSFGPTPCGFPTWPGIYTRVIDYIPWILSKMEP